MGTLADWEKVNPQRPLGSGGQSTVYSVRRPERTKARQRSFAALKVWSGQDLGKQDAALAFSKAAVDIAREDHPSELGALKMFNPRAAGPEAEQQALGRMRSEIAILAGKRPGLLKLLDSNESERWIVTEYCHRGTLEGHLPRYKGNAKLALKSFLSLVQTVVELHKESIVHRDIKPQNVFVGDNDELLLGDFGIVFLPNQAERLTVTGESVGPHDYMPLWAFLGEPPETVSPNFDVYMLGKVLWCMVAGRLMLYRESYWDPRYPQFNLAALFPDDPNMHVINTILEKCLVEEPKDCWSSLDVYQMVGAFSRMMQRDGQLLKDGVPRPCRVCGVGHYSPEKEMPGQPNTTASIQLSRVVTNARINTGEPVGGFKAEPFACNKCGHVQFFKVGEL
jgi:serine/threonine protein kinase